MHIKETQISKIIIKNLNFFYLISFFLISLYLTFTIFREFSIKEIVYSGDMYFPFSKEEILKNFFFIFSLNEYGSFDGLHSVIHLMDNLTLLFLHSIFDDVQYVQKIYFFILFLIFFILNYFSFLKINLNLTKKKNLYLNSFLLTLISVCLPYLALNFHGGSVNIAFVVSYSLSPLALFYFFKLNNQNQLKIKTAAKLSFVLFLISHVFWLVSALIISFMLIFLFFLFKKIKEKKFIIFFLNIFTLVCMYLLLFSPNLYLLYLHYYQYLSLDAINQTMSYGNMVGGLMHQIKMYSSWALSYDFNPRGFFPFKDYYFSGTYLLGITTLYISAFIYFFYKTQSKKFVKLYYFLFLFTLLSIFLGKGSQPPFGEFFKYMINFNFFKIFRTPDNRFGFMITICILLMLCFSFINLKTRFKITITIIIIVTLGYPIFSGTWINGNYKNVDYDRVIKINDDLINLKKFMNKNLINKNEHIYILNGSNYDFYYVDEEDFYRGTDLLPKVLSQNILYSDKIIKGNKLNSIDKIKNTNYFIIRNDLYRKPTQKVRETEIDLSELKLIYKNNFYKLYERKYKNPFFLNGANKIYNLPWFYTLMTKNEKLTIKISKTHDFKLCELDRLNILFAIKAIVSCNNITSKQNENFYSWDNLAINKYYLFFNKYQIRYYSILCINFILFITIFYVSRKKI
jgi:hypothetical protein